jgi:large subunit ribosomal protein L23
MKDPYTIIESEHITEKSTVLAGLEGSESNKCTKRCNSPKRVFIVKTTANKLEIAQAIEAIHTELNLRVVKVNTINIKPKPKQLKGRRGRAGFTPARKKAVVTFAPADAEALRNL